MKEGLTEADVRRIIQESTSGMPSVEEFEQRLRESTQQTIEERDHQRDLATFAEQLIESAEGILPSWKKDLKARYAMLPEGLAVLKAWGFTYKSNIVWHKVRKDGGSDGRGVGFYFRNVTELILFGVRGKNARTLAPGRRQVNLLATRKREHSRKPDEQYEIIEACSRGPFVELFGRGVRKGWTTWGNQADDGYAPTWKTYANHSQAGLVAAE